MGYLGRLPQPLRLARRRRVPHLGLPGALPAARPGRHAACGGALPVAWLSGGAGDEGRSEFGDVFLAFHVGLILAAFAGFTLAAGLAGLYLWQERRLKSHAPGVLRLRAPSQLALDTLTGRTISSRCRH